MKKMFILLLILAMVAGVVFAQTLKDGSYTTRGGGYLGDITVRVTVSEGRMTNIEVVEHQDTPMWVADVVRDLIPRLIQEQRFNVDATSGATGTSEGIKQAVRLALVQARS